MKQWVHNSSVSAHAQYYIWLHQRSTAAAGLRGYCRLLTLLWFPSRRPQPTSYILLHEAYRQDGSTWRKTAQPQPTAFPALPPLAPSRRALARGSFTPSRASERRDALD